MDRDDLRAALGDLASQVAPLHADALPAVQERGRHRRHRRNRVVTGLTSAALIAVLFAGIAIAGQRQAPPGIATGPRPTTTSASVHTSAPHATSEVCTEADFRAVGDVSMPTPARVTKTRVFDSGRVRLDPPPASPQPAVPASAAWAALHGVAYRAATYEIVLTSYNGYVPSQLGFPDNWNRLAWVVIGHRVPWRMHGGPPLPGVTTVPGPACTFATQLFLVDANTGRELEESTFGA